MSALMNYIFESFCLSCMAQFPELNPDRRTWGK